MGPGGSGGVGMGLEGAGRELGGEGVARMGDVLGGGRAVGWVGLLG